MYRHCEQYRRIIPLLEEWGDQLVWHCNSSRDILFFTDANLGKCADLAKGMLQQLLLQLLASIILILYREHTIMATLDFVEPRYSMSFKQM
jgi:hypothetical protein